MRRALVPCLSLVLVVPGLTSCGLLGLGGSGLEDALEVVPGDATQVTFVDRAGLAERLDVEDADVDAYLEAVRDDPVGGTDLLPFAQALEDAPLTELDVEWSVTGQADSGRFVIYKVDDDLDLDEVSDALAEVGYAEDELSGRRHFSGGLSLVDEESRLLGGRFPPSFLEVTVDPDERLVITGRAEAVLETVDDDRDSLTDTDRFDVVTDGAADVELAILNADVGCTPGGVRATPEQLAALDEEMRGLAAPVATAYLLGGDDLDPTARLEFADEDAAAADLEARTDYLEQGLLVASGQPFSDLGTAELEQDGAMVTIELDLVDTRNGQRLAVAQDGPFACASLS